MEEILGQEPEGTAADTETAQDDGKVFDAEYVKGLRAEAAKYRTRLKELEGKVGEYEQERMTETEKLRAQAEAAKTELRNARREAAIAKVAAKEGVDPSLVARLVDVEFDDGDNPIDVEAAVTEVLSAYPQLRPVRATATTNPQRKRALTIDEVKKMSTDEINRRWDEVKVAMGG